MTCNACGEKPKDTAKDFTKAVIEINNPETLVLLRKVVIPASMGTEEDVPAAIGKYHNVILHYEANKHTYLYSSDGIPTLLEMEIPQEVLDKIDRLEDGLEQETTMREGMDEALQLNIDAVAQDLEDFKNSPDVVDIVPTYAALQSYDTSELGNNDEVRVLADETRDGASAYYRWDKTNSQWIFIGITGPYYTKSEIDATVQGIEGDIEDIQSNIGDLSTLTTTDKTSTVAAINEVVAGLTPVVQTTGTSTTDVMSQDATTKMVYEDGEAKKRIRLGDGASVSNDGNVAIGANSSVTGTGRNKCVAIDGTVKAQNTGIAIGGSVQGDENIAIGGSVGTKKYNTALGFSSFVGCAYGTSIGYGSYTKADYSGSGSGCMALGAYSGGNSNPDFDGNSGLIVVSMEQGSEGTTRYHCGYNGSRLRIIRGLYEPQLDHDAATKGYVDPSTDTTAPTTSTAGRLGEIRIDTSTNTAYMCVSADSTSSTYTWKQITS